jgi:hypothetical protein
MLHFDANHSYAVNLTGKVIFDAPLPGGTRPPAYVQPEITTQPDRACEHLLRRSSFGIAPPLPQPAGELSKGMHAVLLHVSRVAVQPTHSSIGHRPLDRAGLTVGIDSHQDRLDARPAWKGSRTPIALVRLSQGRGARYTTPQIAGVQPPAADETQVDQAANGIPATVQITFG